MNTQNNAYVTKFSSGLILAILALSAFSGVIGILSLAPTVHASGVVNPTVAINNPWYAGTKEQEVSINFTNPAGNSVAVSQFTVTAPAGWSINGCEWESGYFDDCTNTATSITWYPGSGGLAIPPGGTQELLIDDLVYTSCTTYPCSAAFPSTWEDNNGVFHTGPSLTFSAFDPTSAMTLTPDTAQTFTAGTTGITFTANIGVPDAGVPVRFDSEYMVGSITGVTSLHSWVGYGLTSATGVATATFTPQEYAAGNPLTVDGGIDFFYATIGGGLYCFGTYSSAEGACPVYAGASTDTKVTTIAGAPAEVTIQLPGFADTTAPNHYTTTEAADALAVNGAEVLGSAISVSLADHYANPVAYIAGDVLTLTANNGRFNAPGAAPTTTKTQITCADFDAGVCPAAGTSLAMTGNNYFQSTIYGTIGSITGALTRSGTTYTGVSGEIITSTLCGACVAKSPPPTPAGATLVNAGSTVTVGVTVAPVQQGVPVTLYLNTATSVPYNHDGHFTGAGESVVLDTTSAGTVSTTYAVDTGATATQEFVSNVAAPIDGDTTNTLGNSTNSGVVTTQAGSPSNLIVDLCYLSSAACTAQTATTNTVYSSTIYVEVILTDAFGNIAENTGVNQIQISLVPSAGVLSATNIYIPSGFSNTYKGFGPIAWTVPGTAQTLTLTASGVVNGVSTSNHTSIGDVSPLPTISVTSPVPHSGYIYSSTTNPVFMGQANVSIGYPSTVTIASISYKVDTNSWVATGAGGSNKIHWSTSPTLSVGVHTITFNATDSIAPTPNVVVSQPYTVLVDTTAPTATFTTPTGATVSPGGVVSATVTVAEGDLNFTTVTASVNGTALPASDVSVTGTNDLGSSVTYTVSISNLPAGYDTVGLSATSLAGLTGTATTITVTAQVQIDDTFTASGSNLPTFTTENGLQGISVTWTNDPSPTTAQFWIQFVGPTTEAAFVGATVAAGASTTVFFGTSGLAPGSYTATVYVSVGLTPYSPVYSVTFTVS